MEKVHTTSSSIHAMPLHLFRYESPVLQQMREEPPPIKEAPFLFHKPELAHPSSVSIAWVGKFLDRIENVNAIDLRFLENHGNRIDEVYLAALEKSHKEESDIQDQLKEKDIWDFLRKMLVTFLAATSIVIGMMTGNILLIASGGMSLVGNILLELPKHPRGTEGLTAVGGAISLVGSSLALLSGSAPKGVLGRVVSGAIGILNHGTTIVSGSLERDLTRLEGEHTLSKKILDTHSQESTSFQTSALHASGETERLYDLCRESSERQKQAIQTIIANSGPLAGA